MAKKDWTEIQTTLEAVAPELLKAFIHSQEIFFPEERFSNPFDSSSGNFSATQFGKEKPGNWIPLYHPKELSSFFYDNKISPVRSGQAEFFFYRGSVFFDLQTLDYTEVTKEAYKPIESFVPLTLKVDFQRNENAYLNKAVALGIINHFIDGDNFTIFEKEISNRTNTRLLYGQFGKIKLTTPVTFKTTKGSKAIKEGFQFEIDLVLENEDEIIIFEAKTGSKPRDHFSLLQLYYPLIYFRQLTKEAKKIRTVFIDIVTPKGSEEYRLVEVNFVEDCFDKVETRQFFCYFV